MKKTLRKLTAARDDVAPIRVERSLSHSHTIEGYVVGIGKKWALLSVTDDGGYFDGYLAFRLADVKRVSRDTSLTGRFAPTQPEWPPAAPQGLDLDSRAGLLTTAAALFPLVGVQEERQREGLWIGNLIELDNKRVWLREIRPDASWHDFDQGYRRRAVTSVIFDDRYMRALIAVGGEAPSAD